MTRHVSIILLALSCLPVLLSQNAHAKIDVPEEHFTDTTKESSELLPEARRKRSLLTGVREVLAGMKATRQLLEGAKPIISPIKGRSDYVKQGDYGTAVGDFFALRPSDIQDIKHSDLVVGKMGRVGNLMITVEHRIYTGTAVTEIIKGAGTVDQRTLKHILYVEPGATFKQ